MSKERLFLDMHVVQTLPPSNINRDDTGSPKSAIYGGVNRARVSSQAWKRAIRQYFNDNGADAVGVRTLRVGHYVAEKIREIDSSIPLEEALKMAKKVLGLAKIKVNDKKDYKTSALFFMGSQQAKGLAQAAIDGVSDKKEIQSIANDNPEIDIALFGRMLADDPSLNEDASSQVAHALSTHEVATEYDYYTAVDDMNPEGTSGAGMLGTMEFNSSTLYRYANVAVHEFLKQMNNDPERVVAALQLYIEAFANSLPTGKINSYANTTLPALLAVSLRTDRPASLVTAFEKPVRSQAGYVEKSIEKLDQEAQKIEKFVDAPYKAFYVSQEAGGFTHLGQAEDSLQQLLLDVATELKPLL